MPDNIESLIALLQLEWDEVTERDAELLRAADPDAPNVGETACSMYNVVQDEIEHLRKIQKLLQEKEE